MLHLIFQSPIDPAILDRMAADDVGVFLENAVLGVRQNNIIADKLLDKLNICRFCVLSEDMAIRGILVTELLTGLETIDYAGLVQLTVDHSLIQSWY